MSPPFFVVYRPITEATWTSGLGDRTSAQVNTACNRLITLGITRIYRAHQDLGEAVSVMRKRLGK